jgi:hypothetical protein
MTSRLGESDYRTAGPRSPGGLASWPSDAPTGCAATRSAPSRCCAAGEAACRNCPRRAISSAMVRSPVAVLAGSAIQRGLTSRVGVGTQPVDCRGGRSGQHVTSVSRVDEDGDYYIVGRKRDLIIHGGYNVYPREMEEVLYEHPAGRGGCDRYAARRAG